MTRVACFGCSFTGGVYNDSELRESWPYRLSLQRPDLTIYNFGRQGTSILYSINILEQATRQQQFDYVISQLTIPTRMTFYSNNFRLNVHDDMLKITDNYYVLPMSLKGIIPINGIVGKKELKEINVDLSRQEKYKLLEQLFIEQDDYNHFEPEYRALVSRLSSLSNFVFFHKMLYKNIEGLEKIPTVEQHLGTEEFIKLIIDKGYHFGREGAHWTVKWLLEQTKL